MSHFGVSSVSCNDGYTYICLVLCYSQREGMYYNSFIPTWDNSMYRHSSYSFIFPFPISDFWFPVPTFRVTRTWLHAVSNTFRGSSCRPIMWSGWDWVKRRPQVLHCSKEAGLHVLYTRGGSVSQRAAKCGLLNSASVHRNWTLVCFATSWGSGLDSVFLAVERYFVRALPSGERYK